MPRNKNQTAPDLDGGDKLKKRKRSVNEVNADVEVEPAPAKQVKIDEGTKLRVAGQEITIFTPAKNDMGNVRRAALSYIRSVAANNKSGFVKKSSTEMGARKRLSYGDNNEIKPADDQFMQPYQSTLAEFKHTILELRSQILDERRVLAALENKLKHRASSQYQSHLVNYVDSACAQYVNLCQSVTNLRAKIDAYIEAIVIDLEDYAHDDMGLEEIGLSAEQEKQFLLKTKIILDKMRANLDGLQAVEDALLNDNIQPKVRNKGDDFLALLSVQTRTCLEKIMPINNQHQQQLTAR